MTPIKRTPLYQLTNGLSAEFIGIDNWQIPNVYTNVPEEMAAAQRRVVLADATHQARIRVEGHAAAQAFAAIGDVADLKISSGRELDVCDVYRLRRDLFFVSAAAAQNESLTEALTAAAASSGQLITVTNVSHGQAELHLIGPDADELLSRLCGLDFYPAQFPNHSAKQSSVAKTQQLIVRKDINGVLAYAIIGPRSLAAYLWETIMQAGQDLKIQPVGIAAVKQLASAV